MPKQLLLVATIIFLSKLAVAQDIAQDSINIRTFGSRDYKAAIYNFSVLEDENGIMYFSNDNGVLEYDGSEWRLIKIKDYSGVVVLEKFLDGKIYVGGIDEFGYLERDSTGQFEYHSLRSQLDVSLEINEVWQIESFDNQIYFQSYEFIFRYDGEGLHVISIKDSWLLPFNSTMHIATYDYGLSRLENDSLVPVNTEFKLKGDAPFMLLPGPKGKKLALTEYNGIYLLDTTNYSYEKWNVSANEKALKYGLYDAMMWDDSTYLFSLSEGGLMWVNEKGKMIREINKSNGLSTNYMREFIRDSRGNLWLASEEINYLTWPDKVNTDNFRTLLRSIDINDSTTFVNTNNGNLSIDKNAPLSSLVFHYATPGFDRTDLEYSYYLDGFDPTWSSWNSNVKKEYTNLSAGDYVFHVKARLHDGSESIPASINVNIPKVWYASRLAITLGTLLLSALIWLGVRLRMTHLKSLNKRLEYIISNRTKELVEQKEELHQANEELTLANTELDNFVYRSSHDLIAPLKSLKGLIDITLKESSEEAKLSYFRMMNNSIEKLEDFIQSILEYSTNSKGVIENEEIILQDIIDNVVEDLKYFDRAEKVELKCSFGSTFSFNSDPKRIKIIFSNLIANAVKYHNFNQPNPRIDISAVKENGSVKIKVTDNGQGIDSSHLVNLFDMFYRASENSQGSGLGLYIVKDTIDKLNGNITVESDVGKGTTFTMAFN